MDFLPAVKLLIKYYSGECSDEEYKYISENCPLCDVGQYGFNCKECPWKDIEGLSECNEFHCEIWLEITMGYTNFYRARQSESILLADLRLPMLREWEAKLEKEAK